MKILFCGGGTGGHVSPAIAIAEYTKKHYKNAELAFVGRKSGEENEAIKKRSFKLYEIEIYGFQRKLSIENFKKALKLPTALKEAKRIINEFRPDAVIGTGGYVTWPVIRCAQKMKIPTYIHESNAYPGLVTRLLAKGCCAVFINMPEAKNHLKRSDNVICVGNPVREEFFTTDRRKARAKLGIRGDEFFIVSYGGSGGSQKMNDVLLEFIDEYSSQERKVKHVHASGTRYYDEIIKRYPDFKEEKNGVMIKPYLHEMPLLLNAADAVISRSGAMTVSELSASKAASILIPSPNVTNNHQYENAKALSDKNAAILINESELTKDLLINSIESLRRSPKYKNEMMKNISSLFIKDSEKMIIGTVLKNLPDN